jgi:hypothetical protein
MLMQVVNMVTIVLQRIHDLMFSNIMPFIHSLYEFYYDRFANCLGQISEEVAGSEMLRINRRYIEMDKNYIKVWFACRTRLSNVSNTLSTIKKEN